MRWTLMVSGFESNNESQLNEIGHFFFFRNFKDASHKLKQWVEPVLCQIAQTNGEYLFRTSTYEWLTYNQVSDTMLCFKIKLLIDLKINAIYKAASYYLVITPYLVWQDLSLLL